MIAEDISQLKHLYLNKQNKIMLELSALELKLAQKQEELKNQQQKIHNLNVQKYEFKVTTHKELKNKVIDMQYLKLKKFSMQEFEKQIEQAIEIQAEMSNKVQAIEEDILKVKAKLRNYLIKTEKYLTIQKDLNIN